MSDSNNGGSGVGVLIFLGLLWWANQPTKISMDEAIADHWAEIQNYISGTENIEACSDSGCYSLDAEIQSGSIISVHFPNGGYLSIDAEIDEDGNASDIDSRGRSWEFNVDMGVIEAAVEAWDEAEKDFEVESQ